MTNSEHNYIVKLGMMIIVVICIGISLAASAEPKRKNKPQQKIIFSANQVFYGPSTGAATCKQFCSKYQIDIKAYLEDGWRVVSSTSKEEIALEFQEFTIDASTPFVDKRDYGHTSYGCKCIGTEYIIEK